MNEGIGIGVIKGEELHHRHGLKRLSVLLIQGELSGAL
jgi:hypothetical protein